MGGACSCNKTTPNELNSETGPDLVIDDNNLSYFAEKSRKVKSYKADLMSRFNTNLINIGEVVSKDSFAKMVGEDINRYSIEHPYYAEYEGDTTKIIEHEPIKFTNTELYYFGSWNSDCQPEGPGQLYNAEDQNFVEGVWIRGNLIKGRIMFDEGIYEGEIEDNAQHGKGKMTYKDGREYEGEYVNGNKEGNGRMEWEDGSNYWGEFANDEINGSGEFNWNNGCTYKGDFVNGVFDGKGALKAPNGSIYIGEFKDGVYHGKGKFIWGGDDKGTKTKEMYIGEYAYGKKCGKGKYFFLNKDVFEGEWSDNKPHGQGQLETESCVYKCFWRNGERVESPLIVKKNNDENGNIDEKKNLNFKAKLEDINYNMLTNLKFEPRNSLSIMPSRIGLNAKEEIFGSLRQIDEIEEY